MGQSIEVGRILCTSDIGILDSCGIFHPRQQRCRTIDFGCFACLARSESPSKNLESLAEQEQLGPGNAEALETTFGVFYKLALSLSFFLRHEELLTVNAKIRGDVAHAFNALLNLVREVTVTYYGRIIGISAHGLTLDFNSVFGHQLEVFYGLKNNIVDKMWENALAGNFSVDIRTIRNWLSPRDRTMQTILSDRLTDRSHRAEYSCEWFQRYLLDFSRGQDDVLAITAPSGCGKTVLSGYIVERLQRPLARKNFQTLSYNIGMSESVMFKYSAYNSVMYCRQVRKLRRPA